MAEWTDDTIGNLMGNTAFDGGEELWENVQKNVTTFINKAEDGGAASIISPTIERIDYEELKNILEGKKSVSELGCK